MKAFSKKPKQSADRPDRRLTNETATERSGMQFRRNQTLVNKRQLSDGSDLSSRDHVHHLTTKRRKAGLIFTVSVAVVVALAVLLSQFIATVNFANISTDTVKSFSSNESKYQQAVISYFGVHPVERLKFMLDNEALSEYVTSLYSEVESVELAESSGYIDVTFDIKFRQAVAEWNIGDSHHYVDGSGVVFDVNYFAEPSVTIVDDSGIEAQQGQAIASTRLLGFVGQVVSLSSERGYTVQEATLPEGTTRRLDIKLDGIQPVIRFTTDREAGEQVSDMSTVLAYMQSRGMSASYIDVRVSERVVYK